MEIIQECTDLALVVSTFSRPEPGSLVCRGRNNNVLLAHELAVCHPLAMPCQLAQLALLSSVNKQQCLVASSLKSCTNMPTISCQLAACATHGGSCHHEVCVELRYKEVEILLCKLSVKLIQHVVLSWATELVIV